MFSSIPEIISDLKRGKIVVLVDGIKRENEGDLVCAGEFATPKNINFMITNGKGLVCAPISEKIAKKFALKLMGILSGKFKTAFTISIDARKGITTGISAFDRSKTIKILANRNSKKTDLLKPGHVFPLISKKGGVLQRQGHTEAAIELMKLAKLKEVGVICEIVKENGQMARRKDLIDFAKKHCLKIATINELIEFLKQGKRQTPV